MARRPNIVLTIADDQRWNTIGSLGNPHIHTPCLDRLAARGTSYRRAQHGGSSHGAVCGPSRAQLHTGRSLFHTSDSLHVPQRPLEISRRGDRSRPLPTLGSMLRDAGYDTFGIGKWHNEADSFVRSFESGGRVFLGGMCPHFCVPTHLLKRGSAELEFSRIPPGHSTDLFAQAAVEFIQSRQRQDDRPFFLYVAFTAPHDPRETYHRFRALYGQEPPAPGNFMPEHPFCLNNAGERDEALAEYPRNPAEVRMYQADYYAMLSHLDEGLGRIHGALEAAGLDDDTIVVHTADHGLSVGQHGLMGKQSLYDHSTRVPLIAAGPGFEHGRLDDRLCYQHDLHPTLLDAAGLDNPDCDFQHLLSGSPRSVIGCAYARTMRSVRDARLKLIEYDLPDGRRTQLFDTQQDPEEINDLSGDPRHGPDLHRLRAAMQDHLATIEDPLAGRFCSQSGESQSGESRSSASRSSMERPS